jgi:hypothetical protein
MNRTQILTKLGLALGCPAPQGPSSLHLVEREVVRERQDWTFRVPQEKLDRERDEWAVIITEQIARYQARFGREYREGRRLRREALRGRRAQ